METINFKDGDILICTSNRIIPSLIKNATKSKWTHTAQVFNCWDIVGVIEAQAGGIHWMPFDEWVKKYNYQFIVYRRNVLKPIELAQRAFSKLGHTAYDYHSFVIRQPISLVTGKFYSKPLEKEEDKMICSEFTAWTEEWMRPETFTPDKVEKYCRRSYRYKLIQIK